MMRTGPLGPTPKPWEKPIPKFATVAECLETADQVSAEFIVAAVKDHHQLNMAFDFMKEMKVRCNLGQLEAAHRLAVDAQDIAREMEAGRSGLGKGSPRSSCFLTTACCELVGLPDDCFELAALRSYRDEVLAGTADGRREIALYYALAPSILLSIRQRGAERELLLAYFTHILPCALLARLGLNQCARRLYAHMLRTLCRRHAVDFATSA